MRALSRAQAAVQRFFFAPASPRPLIALRIGLASVLILQALLIWPGALRFYAGDGLVQEAIAPFFSEPGTPQLATIAAFFAKYGIREAATIAALGIAYIGALAAMAAGWHPRLATATSWLLHWTFMTSGSGSASNYGVEIFAHVFLFYLIWMPCGNKAEPSSCARLSLRVLQIQLCMVYFSSGYEKSLGAGWWNGEAFWNALMLPDYRQYDFGWLAYYPLIPKLGGWMTMLVETFYFVFIWPRATRPLWILAVVGMHLGIAITLGLTVFGVIMSVLTLMVFGVPAEILNPAPSPVSIARGWLVPWPRASALRHRTQSVS
jgi:hypothetical protein